MGAHGPLPKRKADLNGHRSRAELAGRTVSRAPGAADVRQPRGDDDWHPIAKQLWYAMGQSGQTRYYEPSDWAMAYSLVDDLSDYKRQTRRSSTMLASIMSGLSSLLLTEGDRRRLQVELSRPDDSGDQASPGIAELDKWRTKLGG